MAVQSARYDTPVRDREVPGQDTVGGTARAARLVWAVTRIALGAIFLWAFLDKLLGLGHETASRAAWVHGGSPTKGFLAFGTKGPFAGAFHHVAGAWWADTLFMVGLLGIGAALLLGIGMRLAAVSGALLMVLMWSAVLPPENHPVLDDHIVYALVLVGLALVRAGDTVGLGRWWRRTAAVRRVRWLA